MQKAAKQVEIEGCIGQNCAPAFSSNLCSRKHLELLDNFLFPTSIIGLKFDQSYLIYPKLENPKKGQLASISNQLTWRNHKWNEIAVWWHTNDLYNRSPINQAIADPHRPTFSVSPPSEQYFLAPKSIRRRCLMAAYHYQRRGAPWHLRLLITSIFFFFFLNKVAPGSVSGSLYSPHFCSACVWDLFEFFWISLTPTQLPNSFWFLFSNPIIIARSTKEVIQTLRRDNFSFLFQFENNNKRWEKNASFEGFGLRVRSAFALKHSEACKCTIWYDIPERTIFPNARKCE